MIRDPRTEPDPVVLNGHAFRRCPLCDALVDPAFVKSHVEWAHPTGRSVREREESEVSDNRIKRSVPMRRESR